MKKGAVGRVTHMLVGTQMFPLCRAMKLEIAAIKPL